jgi:hypothetical protein
MQKSSSNIYRNVKSYIYSILFGWYVGFFYMCGGVLR